MTKSQAEEKGFPEEHWELNDRADKLATKGAKAHNSTNTKEKEERYKLARKIQRCLLKEQTRQAPLRLATKNDRPEEYVTNRSRKDSGGEKKKHTIGELKAKHSIQKDGHIE